MTGWINIPHVLRRPIFICAQCCLGLPQSIERRGNDSTSKKDGKIWKVSNLGFRVCYMYVPPFEWVQNITFLAEDEGNPTVFCDIQGEHSSGQIVHTTSHDRKNPQKVAQFGQIISLNGFPRWYFFGFPRWYFWPDYLPHTTLFQGNPQLGEMLVMNHLARFITKTLVRPFQKRKHPGEARQTKKPESTPTK